jgi:very-short-patch-repair endonuclease
MQAPDRTKHRATRLRAEMSLPEVLLWKRLKGSQVGGLQFRRQHPVGPYVLDFYCATASLCVEVDGAAYHADEQLEFDEARDAVLQGYGIRTLRLSARCVLKEMDFALVAIAEAARGR